MRPGVYVHMEDRQGAIGGLSALAQVCAADLLEVRRSPSYQSNPASSGLFAFDSELGKYHVPFDSLAEYRHLLESAWGGARFLSTQPVMFAWQAGPLRVHHVPDILVERPDGSRLLIDVHAARSDSDREADFVLKAQLTAVAAESLGWDYQAVEPLPPQRARNLAHFAAFGATSKRVRVTADRIYSHTSWPRSIGGVLVEADTLAIERSVALAAVFHLIWHRRLWLEMSRPVRTHTVLRDRPDPTDAAQPWVRDLRRQ